jgi:adenylate kinase family enzyme
VIDFYKHLGKAKKINGEGDFESVFKQVQDALRPNVIFFYGPPCVGKTDAAKRIASKIKYHYIDLEEFDKQN